VIERLMVIVTSPPVIVEELAGPAPADEWLVVDPWMGEPIRRGVRLAPLLPGREVAGGLRLAGTLALPDRRLTVVRSGVPP
jgi:hypothetical protein